MLKIFYVVLFSFISLFGIVICRPFTTNIRIDGNPSDWDMKNDVWIGEKGELYMFTWNSTHLTWGFKASGLQSTGYFLAFQQSTPNLDPLSGSGSTQWSVYRFSYLAQQILYFYSNAISWEGVFGAVAYSPADAGAYSASNACFEAVAPLAYVGTTQKPWYLSGVYPSTYSFFPNRFNNATNPYVIDNFFGFPFAFSTNTKINHPAFLKKRPNYPNCCIGGTGGRIKVNWPGTDSQWATGVAPNSFNEVVIIPFHVVVELAGDVQVASLLVDLGGYLDQLTTSGAGIQRTVTLGPNGYLFNEGLCCAPTMRLVLNGSATITSGSTTPLSIPVLQTAAGSVVTLQAINSSIQIGTSFIVQPGVTVVGSSPVYATGATLVYNLNSTSIVGVEWNSQTAGSPAVQVFGGNLILNNLNKTYSAKSLSVGPGATFTFGSSTANLQVAGTVDNQGRIVLSSSPGGIFTYTTFTNTGFLQRNGQNFLCPTFTFNVTQDANGCGKITTTVSNVLFGPLTLTWSNGAFNLTTITDLTSGNYTLSFIEALADGCPPLDPIEVNSSSTCGVDLTTSSEVTNPIVAKSSPRLTTLSIILIAAVGGGGCCIILILIVVVACLVSRKKKKPEEIQMDSPQDFSGCIIEAKQLKFGEKLGEGAFGIVYKGQFRKTDVAIKKLISANLSEHQLSEFKEEAKLMKSLPAHPNIVLFRGICLSPLCLVVDFCDGGSLYRLLRTSKISEEDKVRYALDIARGMLHLHTAIPGKAIIHRDLAARNILISGKRACVADFGMARATSEDSSKTQQTVGPLKWMAPEAILEQKYSIKTDVYAYGVTLYEIITQGDPWDGMSAIQASHEILQGKSMQIPKEAPDFMQELIQSCWNKLPSNRPDFSEICDRLFEVHPQDPQDPQNPQNPQSSNPAEYLKSPQAPESNVPVPGQYASSPQVKSEYSKTK